MTDSPFHISYIIYYKLVFENLLKFIDNFFEVKPICLVRGQHYRPKIEQHTVWMEFTPRAKPILDLPVKEVLYLLDVMWGKDMFVRHVNKDGTVNTDKFGYIFKNRLTGGVSNWKWFR